jgi:SAM-dependent methyltransferase
LTDNTNTGKFDPPVTRCAICGSELIAPYHRDSDGIGIYRCGGCHVQFMNPQYSDAYLREYYSRYTIEEPKWDEPLRYCHDFYCSLVERFLPKPGRLLDVGSGKGHLLTAAVSRGWTAIGYEIDPATASTIGKKIGVEVLSGDFLNLPLEPGSFDAVTIHHVLEHLKDPVPYIREAWQLIRPGGVLFVALPNIRGVASTVKFFLERIHIRRRNVGAYYDTGHHLWYFTPATLDVLLSGNGFSTIYKRSGHRVLPNQSRFSRWLMRNITERFVWKSTCIVIARKK